MLNRILSVQGVGLLQDASGAANTFRKGTLFYADNGRGKSTTAALLSSCSVNDPSLIIGRKTLDSEIPQQISLQFDDGHRVTFENNEWSEKREEIIVFDSDFIEKNVHAGGQITNENRRNLLNFALGDQAVAAQLTYDSESRNLAEAKEIVRDLTNTLSTHHRGLTLEQFQNIEEVEEPNKRIDYLTLQIAEANNIERIRARPLPRELLIPDLDAREVFLILQKSMSEINVNAEQRVKHHLEKHEHGKLQSWISSGQEFIDKDSCPLCGQMLDGNDLIQAYKTFFNDEYRSLISDVASLEEAINKLFDESIASTIRSEQSTILERVANWQDRVEVEISKLDLEQIRAQIIAIKDFVLDFASTKQANILASVSTKDNLSEVNARWREAFRTVEAFNIKVTKINQSIEKYKEKLGRVNIAELEQEISNIRRSQHRYSDEVKQLFRQLSEAKSVVEAVTDARDNAKIDLSRIMTETLLTYKNAINQHLARFNSSFRIRELDANFMGGRGQATSQFVLELRGQDIPLGNGNNSFKTALSEGDKRTLAFAFFISYLESLPNLSTKIVVVDDPMCSLDASRRSNTRIVLKSIFESSMQLILLAHDAHFLLDMKRDLLKVRGVNPNEITTVQLRHVANNYSNFDGINLEEKCETTYFKDIRILTEYLDATGGASANEVAKTIRPVMEAYLHMKYPRQIPSGLLFGDAIGCINQAQTPSPLVGIQSMVKELNEINSYAGRFHHNTAPGNNVVYATDETELRGYVTRTLGVIYGI